MIVFVGNEEKGHFIRDVAKKYQWDSAFVKADMNIQDQVGAILQHSDCRVIVYDVEQYVTPAQEIAEEIRKIQMANNAKVVIYASGYHPRSDMIMHLTYQGFQNIIYGDNLAEKKEELIACIEGRTTEQKELEQDELMQEESKSSGKMNSIGIAGAIMRMGTTTQAIQFVKYLLFKGYRACYIEMNNHGYVKELIQAYEGVTVKEEIGCATYQDVDLYFKPEKLPEVLKMGYDYYVYDYGVYNDRDFNKISFLEKDLQILVVGTKPGEFMKTYALIDNNFYNNVLYIFNFIRNDKNEREDIYGLMEHKREQTYFASDCRDPFVLSDRALYEAILPVKETKHAPKKQGKWFRKSKRK